MPDEDDGDVWLWLIRGTGQGDYLARLRKLEQTWSVALGACDLNRDKIKALWYHTREAEAPSDEDEDSDEPMEVTEYWELVGLRLFMYNALHQKVCGTTWDTMALEPTFAIDPRVCRRSCTTQSLSLTARDQGCHREAPASRPIEQAQAHPFGRPPKYARTRRGNAERPNHA